MVSQHCFAGEKRDAYPKGYDQVPPLTGVGREILILPGSVEVQRTRHRIATGCDLYINVVNINLLQRFSTFVKV